MNINVLAIDPAKKVFQLCGVDAKAKIAIAEAAQRPTINFVSPKTLEQQDMQSLLHSQEIHVEMRKKIFNQVRGLRAEYGITVPQGIHKLSAECVMHRHGFNFSVKLLPLWIHKLRLV